MLRTLLETRLPARVSRGLVAPALARLAPAPAPASWRGMAFMRDPPKRAVRRRRAEPQQTDQGYYYTPPPPQIEVPTGGTVQQSDAVYELLSQPTLIIERQLEMMNVFLGFEQANRYVIMDPLGNLVGYMEEEGLGIGKSLLRQVYRLHRPFTVNVYDKYQNHVLTIRRPFALINSHIKALLPSKESSQYASALDDPNPIVIGETIQRWHPWRRRYGLFLSSGESEFDQFGQVDAPFLSFSFLVRNEQGKIMGAVDRNWRGILREVTTDTGIYVLRMDQSAFQGLPYEEDVCGALSLDQRAVMLGTAVSIDFDYFSRHSNSGGFVSYD